jgi:hypothetical protein
MSGALAINACRTCGATNYRRVVARDSSGHLKATGLYQCSGCSVVFADPRAWREGGSDDVDAGPTQVMQLRPVSVSGTSAPAEARAQQAGVPNQAPRPSGSIG